MTLEALKTVLVVGRADAHHFADDLEREPGRHLDDEVAPAEAGHPVDDVVPATSSMWSSIRLIMRGLKAADTMRRRRAWRGLSMLIMEPKYSSISSGMSRMLVAPCPDR